MVHIDLVSQKILFNSTDKVFGWRLTRNSDCKDNLTFWLDVINATDENIFHNYNTSKEEYKIPSMDFSTDDHFVHLSAFNGDHQKCGELKYIFRVDDKGISSNQALHA